MLSGWSWALLNRVPGSLSFVPIQCLELLLSKEEKIKEREGRGGERGKEIEK